ATITRKRKCMVGELSKLLGVSVNTVSELVGRLVEKDLFLFICSVALYGRLSSVINNQLRP
ncbi:unnamed protein product, partial [marine sediment metagenome]